MERVMSRFQVKHSSEMIEGEPYVEGTATREVADGDIADGFGRGGRYIFPSITDRRDPAAFPWRERWRWTMSEPRFGDGRMPPRYYAAGAAAAIAMGA
jgi:hypothetical protein